MLEDGKPIPVSGKRRPGGQCLHLVLAFGAETVQGTKVELIKGYSKT